MHEDITHDMHTLKNDTGSIAALTLSPEAVSVMRFILRFFFVFLFLGVNVMCTGIVFRSVEMHV